MGFVDGMKRGIRGGRVHLPHDIRRSLLLAGHVYEVVVLAVARNVPDQNSLCGKTVLARELLIHSLRQVEGATVSVVPYC